MATIDDLLRALQNPEGNAKLSNTRETWSRIATGDSFDELGLSGGELDDFLRDWISENPYENI